MSAINRYVEAFKEGYNTIGMAAVVAVSFALLSPVPIIGGLVAEAAYLLFVPDSKWYESRLSQRSTAELEARRRKLKEQTLPLLRPEMQERFLQLEGMRKQIDTQSQDDKAWFHEVLLKLDYLLEKFLLFGTKEVQFRDYLQSLRQEIQGAGSTLSPIQRRAPDPRREARSFNDPSARAFRSDEPTAASPLPGAQSEVWVRRTIEEIQAHYEAERQQLESLLQSEQDPDTRAVLAKRADVLQRRFEFAGKIGKILTNIEHQLQLVEDTFGLINDEIRARSPEQILSDIEEVVVATNSMSSALEELAPLDQLIARVSN